MDKFFGNGIVQGVLATLIGALLLWFISFIRLKADESKIVKFLMKSQKETQHTLRSTNAISSDLNLSEDRLRKICSKSKKVRRNQKDKESWCLTV